MCEPRVRLGFSTGACALSFMLPSTQLGLLLEICRDVVDRQQQHHGEPRLDLADHFFVSESMRPKTQPYPGLTSRR